jgi:hypothetical protein
MLLREPQPRAIPPTGKQIAVVYGIVELGNQPDTFGEPGATRYEVELQFRVLVPNDFNVYEVAVAMKMSFHEDAKLRKVVEAAIRHPLTVQDRRGFDARKLLGKPLVIDIAHQIATRSGSTYAKVMGFEPAPDGTVIPDLSEEFVFCGLSRKDFDQKAFDRLPRWTQEKIASSPEFERLTQIGSKASGSAAALPPPARRPTAEIIDDDIPF